MSRCSFLKMVCIASMFCIATAIAASAQTFTSLVSFDKTNGEFPAAPLVQGTNGNFYGTVELGGGDAKGAIFEITSAGTLTRVHVFLGADGDEPDGLVLADLATTSGSFYGITFRGGAGQECGTLGCGTIFESSPSPGGKLNVLHSFDETDGSYPTGLMQIADGNFYGTTSVAGANTDADGGTVFKITPSGTLTTLYNFCSLSGCTDGRLPLAGVVQGTDGNFYGTTASGGASTYYGEVFKMTPSGTLTVLYSFCSECADGANPEGALVQGTDGNLYGTTEAGGASLAPNCFGAVGCGTVFKITPSGTLTSLYSFCSQTNCADGGYPEATLIQATDGNFYGTTASGGAYGYGTVFEITPAGTLTTLHTFDGTDGRRPVSGLLQGTDGDFYGTTSYGGTSQNCTNGCGTVFSLDTGLSPFVAFARASGKVGWTAEILGQGFTGTTAVSFNGTPAASFKVESDTYLKAVVPAGATTGPVTVTTPSGTLNSNVVFTVRP